MKTYIWVTFAFMGWGYYELSGGADFVPQATEVAEVETTQPEIVTRAAQPELLTVSAPAVQAVQAVQATPDTSVSVEVEEATPAVIEIAAPATPPQPDMREVAATRVNMRMGPGTDFDVIVTLDNGTALEVLAVNDQGWANVSTDQGLEGWMAERLLSDPET